MALKDNYYFNSLFWTTLQKVLTAIVGFISVPLLLDYYGKDQYGILSLATACNAYASLLDLGMNTGAVRYFSLWKAEGNIKLVHRVARTNLSFYCIVSFINAATLVLLAIFGEPLFSTTHDQYLQLQKCLFIIAGFCFFSWGTTSYNQLLIANKQMAFTAQMACMTAIGKLLLVVCVFLWSLPLSFYFFFLTALTAILYFPYAYKCKKDGMIDSYLPAGYWRDFKIVLTFSLSIFALGLFQMAATQSRPLILGIFSDQGPSINAEYKIIQVVPNMLLMIGGTFIGLFLPVTTELVSKNDTLAIKDFSYKWTTRTTILMNVICFPCILCAKEILCAYVGEEYSNLSIWLILWCITALIQMHTTPANSLVLSYGRTKALIVFTSIFCIVSMILNALLCPYFGVGSAIISYGLYVVFIISSYYLYFYKKILNLSRFKMTLCFLKPTIIAAIIAFVIFQIDISQYLFEAVNTRILYLAKCVVNTISWGIVYVAVLQLLKVENIKTIFKK